MEENRNKYLLNLKIKLLDEQFKEIPSIPKINRIIEESGYLVRKINEIKIVDSQSKIKKKQNEELLFHIRMSENNNLIKIENPISCKNLFQTEELFKYLDTRLWYLLNSINPIRKTSFAINSSIKEELTVYTCSKSKIIIRFSRFKVFITSFLNWFPASRVPVPWLFA